MICAKCNKEIPDDSTFCLHCGATQANEQPVPSTPTPPVEQPKKKTNGCLIATIIVIGILFVLPVIIISLLGVMNSSLQNQFNDITRTLNDPTSSSASPQAKKPDLEVIEKSSEAGYVVGKIRNNTDRQYSYVQVEINLYDGDENQVGSTLANTNNLEPNGIWRFKAVVLESNAKSFKIKEVTGF